MLDEEEEKENYRTWNDWLDVSISAYDVDLLEKLTVDCLVV